jgi:hypothetical protein
MIYFFKVIFCLFIIRTKFENVNIVNKNKYYPNIHIILHNFLESNNNIGQYLEYFKLMHNKIFYKT